MYKVKKRKCFNHISHADYLLTDLALKNFLI